MRKALVAVMAASMMFVLPGVAGATTKTFSVTLKVTPINLVIETCEGEPTGASFRLTGTVDPIRADKYVTIYKKIYGSTWRIEGYARVRSSGRFTFYDQPTTKTRRWYKAKMPTTGSWYKGYSDPVWVWAGKDSCPD
jgi:hypothetical protein